MKKQKKRCVYASESLDLVDWRMYREAMRLERKRSHRDLMVV